MTMTPRLLSSKLTKRFSSIRKSEHRGYIAFLVYATLIVDNILLTVVGKVIGTVNVTGETLVLKNNFPGFMLGASLL